MRNEWAYDVLDFEKYALARYFVREGGFKVGICSMINGPSVSKVERATPFYIKDPAKRWRVVDPELFDWFELLESEGHRSTQIVYELGLVPSADFYLPEIPRKLSARSEYFRNCWGHMSGNDICFFDPDTGLIPGRLGARAGDSYRSQAHLYYDEVAATYQQAFSVIIFQHYDRTPRQEFINTKADLLKSVTRAPAVISFITPHVMFLCAPQPQIRKLDTLMRDILERWTSSRFLRKKRALEIRTH